MAVSIGLDIGGEAVRVAVLDTSKSKRTLRRFVEMPLPSGAVVAGDILDEGAVGEVIAALWKRHKLPRKGVVVGTANQRLVVRQVDLPQMEESELAEALPFQVQDSIPMAVDEAVLDFVPLEDFVTPSGEPMMSILVVAVHREVVDTLMRVLAVAKITPKAIDLQSFGLVRAVYGMAPAVDNPLQLIVDIGATVTQVVIAKGGSARFVRLLPRGGDEFTKVLEEAMSVDTELARETKMRVGVDPDEEPGIEDEDSNARQILTRTGDQLIEEVRGSVNFFRSQNNNEEVVRLVVAGNGARMPHLANRLAAALGIPLEPARILDLVNVGRVGLSDEEMQDAQPVLPTAIGLSLWGEL